MKITAVFLSALILFFQSRTNLSEQRLFSERKINSGVQILGELVEFYHRLSRPSSWVHSGEYKTSAS